MRLFMLSPTHLCSVAPAQVSPSVRLHTIRAQLIRTSGLVGIGLRILERRNVIIRNLKIGKCIAPCDSIGVQGQATENIWIDHVELYADQDHDKVILQPYHVEIWMKMDGTKSKLTIATELLRWSP